MFKVRYHEDGRVREDELPLGNEGTGPRIQEILAGHDVLDMHTEEATLEDIFILLTGKKLG